MMPDRPSAAYIHVPFCRHHCGYCDFTVIAGRDQLIPQYLQALRQELSACEGPHRVDTLFFGGGTPTHLSPDDLNALLELVLETFPPNPGAELSVEANPESLGPERLAVLAQHGVNRLSLGVQAFSNDCLETLERGHSADSATDVIHRAAAVIPNVSIDLIFAVPGQTEALWNTTLTHACSLPVQHISTYGLTYEEGTPFHRRRSRGQLHGIADDTERSMYMDAIRMLTDAGFRHYEVSNFARSGSECRHNLTYWTAREFFGVGPGAARYVNGVRTTNCRSVIRWLKNWQQGVPCVQETESLSDDLRCREAAMLGLRMIDGIDLSQFESRFGCHASSLAGDAFARHMADGLLEIRNNCLRLTTDGLLLADTVVSDFL